MVKEHMTTEQLDQPVTLGVLLEYTDSFLIPRLTEIMDERFAKVDLRFAEQEYRLKDYIDKKLGTFESDLTNRYDRRYVLKKV